MFFLGPQKVHRLQILIESGDTCNYTKADTGAEKCGGVNQCYRGRPHAVKQKRYHKTTRPTNTDATGDLSYSTDD